MKIALLSPYHGGSHAAWADGWRRTSRHDVELFTLPARFWKWRMHGGALTLARRFLAAAAAPDLIVATDMLDLTTFLALTRRRTARVPTVLYMHENQLTYPLPDSDAAADGPMRRQLGERDHHYAFINVASMLAADQVIFNSEYHRTSFLAALPRFLKHFPEFNELNMVAVLRSRTAVLPVGIDRDRLFQPGPSPADRPATPLILWNQRWEYDKNPRAFFAALYRIKEEGLPFRLALCGENFRRRPAEFSAARAHLADHIIHVGHASPARYRHLLRAADITLSTAHHEFFGISILEAMAAATFPILPRRLSYPELLPEAYHLKCLYENEAGLLQRLRWSLTARGEATAVARALAEATAVYDWPVVAARYDALMDAAAR